MRDFSIGAYSQEGPQLNTRPRVKQLPAKFSYHQTLTLSLSTISFPHLMLCGKGGKFDHKVEATHVFHVSDLGGHLQGLFEERTIPFLPHEIHWSQWKEEQLWFKNTWWVHATHFPIRCATHASFFMRHWQSVYCSQCREKSWLTLDSRSLIRERLSLLERDCAVAATLCRFLH